MQFLARKSADQLKLAGLIPLAVREMRETQRQWGHVYFEFPLLSAVLAGPDAEPFSLALLLVLRDRFGVSLDALPSVHRLPARSKRFAMWRFFIEQSLSKVTDIRGLLTINSLSLFRNAIENCTFMDELHQLANGTCYSIASLGTISHLPAIYHWACRWVYSLPPHQSSLESVFARVDQESRPQMSLATMHGLVTAKIPCIESYDADQYDAAAREMRSRRGKNYASLPYILKHPSQAILRWRERHSASSRASAARTGLEQALRMVAQSKLAPIEAAAELVMSAKILTDAPRPEWLPSTAAHQGTRKQPPQQVLPQSSATNRKLKQPQPSKPPKAPRPPNLPKSSVTPKSPKSPMSPRLRTKPGAVTAAALNAGFLIPLPRLPQLAPAQTNAPQMYGTRASSSPANVRCSYCPVLVPAAKLDAHIVERHLDLVLRDGEIEEEDILLDTGRTPSPARSAKRRRLRGATPMSMKAPTPMSTTPGPAELASDFSLQATGPADLRASSANVSNGNVPSPRLLIDPNDEDDEDWEADRLTRRIESKIAAPKPKRLIAAVLPGAEREKSGVLQKKLSKKRAKQQAPAKGDKENWWRLLVDMD